ncbi:MAG: DNA polymerase III subunit gamma/tau [Gemmatimonadetes bacterium]|nr:DNA polymerase III subunit gamma/tau [Gemmatimonadota bacterium]
MIALARKYRPRRFADLLVQDHVAAALRGAVARGRVGHGYLLTGPRGVGKTTAARILAMALNCERQDRARPSGEPCGECPTCERIWSGGANLDVVEIDAASNRSVDDARDLRERAMYAASQEDRYKVYIVDEAHMLTREAWNALLKILEEPPPRVVFVFATTEPQKIANLAAPVLSRLQRFDFRRIHAAAIRDRVVQVLAAEGLAAEDDAVTVIARYADGGMRDALSVLDQALSLSEGALTAERVRQALGLIGDEVYAEVLAAVADQQAAPMFGIVDRLMASGADLVEFIGGMADLLRALLMDLTGADPEGLTTVQRDVIGAARARLTAGDVLRMLALLTEAETSIRRSANARLVVESLLLRWALMDRTVSLEEVLRGAAVGPPGTGTPRPSVASPIERPRSGSDRPVSSAPGPVPPPDAGGPLLVGPLTTEALRSAWPALVERGKAQSHLFGAILAALSPTAVEPDQVRLEMSQDGGPLLEGAQARLGAIRALVTEAAGRPVEVQVGAGVGKVARADRPKRLSDNDIKNQKLGEIRAKDPSLDAAAEALDLEIVE